MFKLIVATCAALYAILLIFGDEARRPAEVARADTLPVSLVTPASLTLLDRTPVLTSDISEREAVELAIAAGKAIREERRNGGSKAVAVAMADTFERDSTPEMSYWYVTGERVNLRGGPGTSNAVVGQVTFGTEAEVLGDQNGWYQIRLADGSASGWIFGKFLNENLPG